MTWARHAPATRFCAVARTEGGSTITHCNGRWPSGDEVEIATVPGKLGCAACRTIVGLLELKNAPAIEMSRVPVLFEGCIDERFDDEERE